MRRATILAIEISFYFVIFEGVSIYVMNPLNDQEEWLASVGFVSEDAKVAAKGVGQWESLNVRRQANEVAHWTA